MTATPKAPPAAPYTYGDVHPLDGGFYADDTVICVRTLPNAPKGKMGGSIAHAQDAATAKALVQRLTLFEPLLAALRADKPISDADRTALLARCEGYGPVGVKRNTD